MADSKMSAADFAAKQFDYVIVGGGTAGLVMAARLSENLSITVGVIEAGLDRSDDLLVRVPMLHTQLYEKPEYDWLFKTTPQVRRSCLFSRQRQRTDYDCRGRMDESMLGRVAKYWAAPAQSTSACLRSHRRPALTIGPHLATLAGIGMASFHTTGSS